jgi:plastocyanin
MDARPTGITYSRQGTTPQAGRPAQPPMRTSAPAPAAAAPSVATATGTATGAATGTTYLTINRGLLVGGLLFSLASPANFGIEGYMFMAMFLVPTVLALILTLSTARAWSYLTATILGVLFPLMFVVMFAPHEGGFDPVNRAGFAVTLLNICALPLIITGGVGGFRNARGKTGLRFGSGFRTAPGVFALCVCSLLAGALVTSYAASDSVIAATPNGFDAQPAATTSVAMKDFAFEPKTINVAAGVYTKIVVSNQDPSPHTFTYKNGGTEYSHEVIPGQTVSFVVMFAEAGSYGFWCIPHSNGEGDTAEDSMTGQIVVA